MLFMLYCRTALVADWEDGELEELRKSNPDGKYQEG